MSVMDDVAYDARVLAEARDKALGATPLGDRLIVRRAPEGDGMTEGGILIPDNAKEKPLEGVVLSVGAGRALDSGKVRPLAVDVGDRVLFGRYSGTEVRIRREDLLILREDEVLAILHPEQPA